MAEHKDTEHSPLPGMQQALGKSHLTIQKLLLADGLPPPDKKPNISAQYEMSQLALEGYATLDVQHYNDIQTKISDIRQYARDRTRRQLPRRERHAGPQL